MGNACGEGFPGPGDPPSQGSCPHGQGSGTPTGHGSQGGYRSVSQPPALRQEHPQGAPAIPWPQGRERAGETQGLPQMRRGQSPGGFFQAGWVPAKAAQVPAPLQGVTLPRWPSKAFPTLPARRVPLQHHCGPGWQPAGPQQGQAMGRATCPRHVDGGMSRAPRVPAHTGTRRPPRDMPIGVRSWLWAHTQERGFWPAGWAVKGLAGERGSRHGCDSKLGAQSTQLCPQDQAASQDTSTGRCRHQGVSLPQPAGSPRASLTGWMEGTAPALEEADAWHSREGSDQL